MFINSQLVIYAIYCSSLGVATQRKFLAINVIGGEHFTFLKEAVIFIFL